MLFNEKTGRRRCRFDVGEDHGLKIGDRLSQWTQGGYRTGSPVVGIVTSGDATDNEVLLNMEDLDGPSCAACATESDSRAD